MIEKTLAKRYASALLTQTERTGGVEETEALLLALKKAYESDPSLRAALDHPKIPRARKAELLRKLFEGTAVPALQEFLSLLVRKNRTNLIPDVAEMFDRLADRSRGVVRVEVRSFLPLSPQQRSALESRLTARLAGRKIDLRAVEDRALLGGLSVRIGDTVIDGSVAARLKELREQLLESERLKVRLGGAS